MPTMPREEAAALCRQIYPTPMDALLAIRKLRLGGWRVLELAKMTQRPDGTRLMATVSDRDTGDSPGDIILAPSPRPADPPTVGDPGE